MAGTLYLIDSNILIRWVQRDDQDYPVVESPLSDLARQKEILCYTSQNLAEFWNACTRPADRNGYGLTPQQRIAAPGFLKASCAYCRMVCQFIKNGEGCC